MITIIGLGPGDAQHWTRAAAQALQQAKMVYLRTAHHASVANIPAPTTSFDNLASQTPAAIATEVLRLALEEPDLVYAVPGHPVSDEASGPIILAQARAQAIPAKVIPGLSYTEAALAALNLNPAASLQLVQATSLATRYHPPLEPDRPALVLHLDRTELALRIKRPLLNAYPHDFEVTLLHALGTMAERTVVCRLDQLETQAFEPFTLLYLPPDPACSGFTTFQETIAHLRSPEGCPWDREQSHQSLRPYLLEETYEVLEALDGGDPVALADEMGDLLLQIVLHTQVATDQAEFKMGTVLDHINRKMLRRHPHVFGNVIANHADEVTANWEVIKQAEKAAKGQIEADPSALDGVPAALPALAEALAISKKAARVGFEWDNIEGVLDKIIEEAQEITQATTLPDMESEVGDLLFSVVNLARWRKIDPESALRATNARFKRRFRQMEQFAKARGQNLADLSIQQLDALWAEAKASSGSSLAGH